MSSLVQGQMREKCLNQLHLVPVVSILSWNPIPIDTNTNPEHLEKLKNPINMTRNYIRYFKTFIGTRKNS